MGSKVTKNHSLSSHTCSDKKGVGVIWDNESREVVVSTVIKGLNYPEFLTYNHDMRQLLFVEARSNLIHSMNLSAKNIVMTYQKIKNDITALATTTNGHAKESSNAVWIKSGSNIMKIERGVINVITTGVGFADGPLKEAKFGGGINYFAVSSDACKMFVSDYSSYRCRMIDFTKGLVLTVGGNGTNQISDGLALTSGLGIPGCLSFNRSSPVPESSLFIIVETPQDNLIRTLQLDETPNDVLRYRIGTFMHSLLPELWKIISCYAAELASLSTLQFQPRKTWSIVTSLVSTPSGHLLIAHRRTILIVDPLRRVTHFKTSDIPHEILAGSNSAGCVDGNRSEARFDFLYSITINDDLRCIYLADYHNHRIRKITLPQRLFIPYNKHCFPLIASTERVDKHS